MLRFSAIFVAFCICIGTVLIYFPSKLMLTNALLVLSPFNFPFPVNPALVGFFSGSVDGLIFPFAFSTQLVGFFLFLLFGCCLARKRLSLSTILVVFICSAVGFVYGDESSRYVATISYFAVLSCTFDLSMQRRPPSALLAA
jgi:hypothetical protein